MTNDLGFLLFVMENNPMFHGILSCAKEFIDNNPYKQICVFNSYSEKLDSLNVPLLHIKQAKFFYGDMIVFDTIGLSLVKEFPNIKNIYFFTSSIPWQGHSFFYKEWQNLMDDKRLHIITSSQETYDIFDIAWKKPDGIGDYFNYETLSKFIQ